MPDDCTFEELIPMFSARYSGDHGTAEMEHTRYPPGVSRLYDAGRYRRAKNSDGAKEDGFPSIGS